MTLPVLQIGDRTVSATELLPLLRRYQLLPLLLRELLIDQAVEGIECSAEEIEPALQQFYEVNQITDETARQDWTLQHGLNPEQLAQLATRPLRIEKFKQQTWGSKLEAHFLTCKAQLDQVIYSLIRTAHPEVAQELYFRLQANKPSLTWRVNTLRVLKPKPVACWDPFPSPNPIRQLLKNSSGVNLVNSYHPPKWASGTSSCGSKNSSLPNSTHPRAKSC